MTQTLTYLTLPALLTIGQLGAAVVVFSEDFEDDTVASLPSIGGTNIGSGYGTVTGTMEVTANPEANGNTSGKVFSGGGADTFANNIPALFAGGAQLIDGMTISFDFYSGTGSHTNDGVRVALIGDENGMRDVFIRNDRDGDRLIDGATPSGGSNHGAEVWQNFAGVFTQTGSDATDYQFDLFWTLTNLETSASISGTTSVGVNIANFSGASARGVLIEGFEGNAAANTYTGYIDNVIVTVPEPGACLLGLLGAAGLLRRRR